MLFRVCPKVNFRRFGYFPSGNRLKDLERTLFGHPNLRKRLEAPEIIKALNLAPTDVALDFGCGLGFFTVEMAKLAKKAYGIDTNPFLATLKVPSELKEKLEFVVASGKSLPFPDDSFDVVLASEVLPMIPKPREFLSEIARVLKPGGRLVVSNGTGHPVIKNAYDNPTYRMRRLKRRYGDRVPESYAAYCKALQLSFGTARNDFFSDDEIVHLLQSSGFGDVSVSHTAIEAPANHLSWLQFESFLATGKTVRHDWFVPKLIWFSIVSYFSKREHSGGHLSVSYNWKKTADTEATTSMGSSEAKA